LRRVCVTGGAGFIGSRVVRKFLERGYKVTVLDDFSTGDLEKLPAAENLNVIFYDVSKGDGLDEFLREAYAVVHLAAVSSVPECEKDSFKAFKVNVKGVENVASACIETGVRKLVFSSSAAVYKNVKAGEIGPQSIYGHTKLLGEEILRNFSEMKGLDVVVLRIFNVYGRKASEKGFLGVVDKFIFDAMAGRQLQIHGDGKQVRDFVHVEDVSEALVLAVEKDLKGFNVFDIGCGEGVEIMTVAELVMMAFKLPSNSVVHMPPRPNDATYSIANPTKAFNLLGFKPKHTLKDYILHQNISEIKGGRD